MTSWRFASAAKFLSANIVILGVCCIAAAPADGCTNSVSCTNDARLTRAPDGGLNVLAKGNRFDIVLVSASPNPPKKSPSSDDTNSLVVRVLNKDGTPAGIASLTMHAGDPMMPDHGHGTQLTPVIAALPEGTYSISNLYLFMPGVWRITLDVKALDGAVDGIPFFFCIQG